MGLSVVFVCVCVSITVDCPDLVADDTSHVETKHITELCRMALRSSTPTASINSRSGFAPARPIRRLVVRRAAAPAQTTSAPAEAKAADAAKAPSKSGSSSIDSVEFINPIWSQPSSEKEFLGLIQKLVDAG